MHSRLSLSRERKHLFSPRASLLPSALLASAQACTVGRSDAQQRETHGAKDEEQQALIRAPKQNPHPERPAPARRHHRLGRREVHEERDDRPRDGDDLAQEDSGHGGLGGVAEKRVFCSFFQGCGRSRKREVERIVEVESDFEKGKKRKKVSAASLECNFSTPVSLPQELARPFF